MRRACLPKVNDKGNAGQNFLSVKTKKPSCKPGYSIQLQKIFSVDVRIFPMQRYAPKRKNIYASYQKGISSQIPASYSCFVIGLISPNGLTIGIPVRVADICDNVPTRTTPAYKYRS